MAFSWKPVRYWTLRLVLLGTGLGVGFAVAYGWYLDRQIARHFAAFTASSQPSRVYARALTLRPNVAMTADTLEVELLAAQYQTQAQALRPGTYAREGGHFLIHTREFDDPSGHWPARRFRLEVARQRVTALADAQGAALAEARIDPARIGIMGFSAGGGVAVGTALAPQTSASPDFLVSLYGPSLMDVNVPAHAPPLFIAVGSSHFNVTNGCLALFAAWKAANKPAEIHVYDQVSAGFGLTPRGLPVDGWIDRMHEWLLARGLTR